MQVYDIYSVFQISIKISLSFFLKSTLVFNRIQPKSPDPDPDPQPLDRRAVESLGAPQKNELGSVPQVNYTQNGRQKRLTKWIEETDSLSEKVSYFSRMI